jgi:Protein of unknown function (DUF4240)
VKLGRLITLTVVAALVFGGFYVARHTDDVADYLRSEKAHLAAALTKRFDSERDKAAAAVKKGLESQRDQAVAAVKKGLESQRDQAVAALKKGIKSERDRDVAKATKGLKSERDRDAVKATKGVHSERDRDVAKATKGVQSERDQAAAEAKKSIDNEREQAAGVQARMDEAAFWQLIAETRTAADNDTASQSALLKERLTQLSPQAIIDFAQIRNGLDERAYTSDLWGAASVIEPGCSDDCFRDFRGYLISLGQAPYENALSDPDSLASVAQDAQTGDWAAADNVAPAAYSSVTGAALPVGDPDLTSLEGTTVDQSDPSALASRYPQLAARFS